MQANHLVANTIWTNRPAVNGKVDYWAFNADQVVAFNRQVAHWRTLPYAQFRRLTVHQRENNQAVYPFWAQCSNMYCLTYTHTALTLRQTGDIILGNHRQQQLRRLITRIILFRYIDDTDNEPRIRAHVHYSNVIQPSLFLYHLGKERYHQGQYHPLYAQDYQLDHYRQLNGFEGLRLDINQGNVVNSQAIEPLANVNRETVTEAFNTVRGFNSILRALQFFNGLNQEVKHEVTILVNQAARQEAEQELQAQRPGIREQPLERQQEDQGPTKQHKQ